MEETGKVPFVVDVPFLRIETGVIPDRMAALDPLLQQVHRVIEPAQLRYPDVAIVPDNLRDVLRVDGVNSLHTGHVPANESCDPAVIRDLITMRFVQHVLQVYRLPAFAFQMLVEGYEKTCKETADNRRVGGQCLGDHLVSFALENLNP